MIEKRCFYTLLTSATISGVLVICTISQNIKAEKIKAKTPPIIEELETAPYVVKEYNGSLAVFRGGSSSPYKILDCDFSLLSDYDKEYLIEGISVYAEAELNSLIEDFTS